MNSVKELRTDLERRRGEYNALRKAIDAAANDIRESERSLRRHEQAREIAREVGLKTQQQLQYHISDITSMALDAVFEEPYELLAEFVHRRNKVECDLLFERNGERIDPVSASGGGAVDVAAFALRIASWTMEQPRSRNTIVLDEPLRFLSADKQEKASQMIQELSRRLGLQFIIVTHEDTLAEYADRIFNVSIKNGKSKVTYENTNHALSQKG